MGTVYQATIHISGHVQGVGFRWTTERVAARFKVTGRVRNLADGRVWLFAEGLRAEVDTFVREVRHLMRDNITDVESEGFEGKRKYSGFRILR